MASSVVAPEEHRQQMGAMNSMTTPRDNRLIKQQAAHHALEELYGALHAELDEARSAMSTHRADRQALLRRMEAAEQAIAELQNGIPNEMSHSQVAEAALGTHAPTSPPNRPNTAPKPQPQTVPQPQANQLSSTVPSDSPLLSRFKANLPISAAAACRSAPQPHAAPKEPLEGARKYMAAAAAQRSVAVEHVCWWFQSGYEAVEGGERLAWSTSFSTGTCSASFSTFFLLKVLECALIMEAREAAAAAGGCGGSGSDSLIIRGSVTPGPAAPETLQAPCGVPSGDAYADSDGKPRAVPPPPEATFPTAEPVIRYARDTSSMASSPTSVDPSGRTRWYAHAQAGGATSDTCMQPMLEPGGDIPGQSRPQISCGVGRCCDAEAAVTGMLRRLVWRYEGTVPRRRVRGVLRDFVAVLQRFASGNAAETPQEQYPPAVHVVSRGADGVAVTVEPQFAAALEMGGGVEDLGAVMAGASMALACVFGSLMRTTLQILAELERQGGCEEEVQGQVDLEDLRARGRACVVEGALNNFLMNKHVCGRVRRDMLQFRACMDGTLCQLEDCNMTVCALLGATPAQAAHAEQLWHEWQRHRAARDARLANALHPLSTLPTAAGVPTAFLLHLSAVAEGAADTPAAGKKRGRDPGGRAGSEEASAFTGELVGVSALASAAASEAARGLLAASKEEMEGITEFLGRVWLPSEVVGEWGMVAVWGATARCRALCDMLRVVQLLAQQRERQRVEGALAELHMRDLGGDAECSALEGLSNGLLQSG